MRQILHIDMNSYFATVEQQANPKLRGKPIAVLGSKAKRSIIVAASVEAKRFGVKTGTRIEDAPKLCPDIVFVHGEPRKYSYVTKKFIEIFEDYTDRVEIFSIDEAFLDVTKTARLFQNIKGIRQNTKITSLRGDEGDAAISSVCHSDREKRAEESLLKRDLSTAVEMTTEKGARDDNDFVGAINIANEIKQRIRNEIGGYITCSVGIASNKFLAKTGSDLQKPDGLVLIVLNNTKNIRQNTKKLTSSPTSLPARSRAKEGQLNYNSVDRGSRDLGLDSRLRGNDEGLQINNLDLNSNFKFQISNSASPTVLTIDEVLLNLPLSEYCGIGKRIFARLGALGIHTTEQLRKAPNIVINKEFGIATGEKLKRMVYGIDSAPVKNWREQEPAKSFGHSRTLDKDVTNRDEIRRHILLLSEKVGRRMRKEDFYGHEVGIWIRYKDFTGTGQSHKIGKWTNDGLEVYRAACNTLEKLDLRQPVRAIGVYVGQVQMAKNTTRSFLGEDELNDKILRTMDAVNNRFGEDAITRATLAGVKLKEIVSGFGRKKF